MGGCPAATGLVVVHGQERLAERDEQSWRSITAHGIGHQYWMEHVLAEGTAPLPWLLLGLGIHADREYRRARGNTREGPEKAYRLGAAEGRDTAGVFTCAVTVEALGKMRMPVSVLARFEDGTEQWARVDRLADVEVLTFRAEAPLRDVVVDPDSAVVVVDPPVPED